MLGGLRAITDLSAQEVLRGIRSARKLFNSRRFSNEKGRELEIQELEIQGSDPVCSLFQMMTTLQKIQRAQEHTALSR